MKKIVAVMLATVLVISVVACGKSYGNKSANQTSKEDSATNKQLVIWTNLTADEQYEVLSKQFEKVASELGCTVTVEKVSFNEMYGKLATAVQAGQTPDIMHTNFGGTAYLYETESIFPMNDIIDEIGKENFSQTYLKVLTGKDGKIYGLPDWAMHTSVWYRQDLFEQKNLEIPTTWDEFIKVANSLNGDNINGFNVPLDSTQVAAQTLYELMCSAGVTFIDPQTGEYCFDKKKDEAIKVIKYLVDLYKNTSPAGSLAWSWGDYRNALSVTGTVAMSLDMGAVIGNAQSNAPDMVEKLGCFDFPGPDGDKKASFGSGYCFVATEQKDAEQKRIVNKFLTKLYTPENAAERALSRPMFAFPSYKPAFDIYKSSNKVSSFKAEVAYILDAYENETWYWYGMENGLNGLSAYIESTGIFGEALQGACDGTYTPEEAYDLINNDLLGYTQ